MSLSERVRAGSEAALWVVEEIAELEHKASFWEKSANEWKLAYAALGGTASESGKEELNNLRAKAKEEDRREAVPYSLLKNYCVKWYYWWHNSSGTNTVEGYDEWFELYGKAMLAAAPKPEGTPE